MAKLVFKATRSKSTANFMVDFKAGDLIYEEGDLGIEMFIVHEGKVALSKQFRDQDQRLALLEKGDFFGEVSLLEDVPRTDTARAVTDGRLLPLNGSTFDSMLRKNPEIAVRMMRQLSRRLRHTDQMLRDVLGSQESQGPVIPGPVAVASPAGKGPERLIHDQTKTEFFLSGGEETSIGRRDPVTGINPDIDLTPADTQRSISRRHAKIFRKEGRYYVREEIGTMNGTFVNGERVETGIPVEFEQGDEVRFGLIKTTFVIG